MDQMTRINTFFLLLLVSSLGCGRTLATTWGERTVTDPVSGADCQVSSPRSYGSYIYDWESKYDQVFWPHTESRGIWHCPESGYVALLGDFDALSESELKAVSKLLAQRQEPAENMPALLQQMQDIYALREISSLKRNRLLRIVARWHQQLDDHDLANAHRKEALLQIDALLPLTEAAMDRFELLLVAANYSRQFGDVIGSDAWLERLQSELDQYAGENAEAVRM